MVIEPGLTISRQVHVLRQRGDLGLEGVGGLCWGQEAARAKVNVVAERARKLLEVLELEEPLAESDVVLEAALAALEDVDAEAVVAGGERLAEHLDEELEAVAEGLVGEDVAVDHEAPHRRHCVELQLVEVGQAVVDVDDVLEGGRVEVLVLCSYVRSH